MNRASQTDRARGLRWYAILLCLFCAGPALCQTNGFLNETGYGYWLAQNKDLGVWWCEGGWKVGRDRAIPPRPHGKVPPVSVSAARREFEPVQIVLSPAMDGTLLSAEVTPLRRGWGGGTAVSVRIEEVAYVEVKQPTDKTCLGGWYPDPLPALRLPLALSAGKNQPLWVTFRVPRDARAGDTGGN